MISGVAVTSGVCLVVSRGAAGSGFLWLRRRRRDNGTLSRRGSRHSRRLGGCWGSQRRSCADRSEPRRLRSLSGSRQGSRNSLPVRLAARGWFAWRARLDSGGPAPCLTTCEALGADARRACTGLGAGVRSLPVCGRLPVAAAPATAGVTSLRAVGECAATNVGDATPLAAASVAGTSARTVGDAASNAVSGDDVVGTSADSPPSWGAGGSKSRTAALT